MIPLTILCVDDQPIVLTTVAAVLRKRGHTVITAANPGQALSAASMFLIDVALVDHSICVEEHLCLRKALHERQPSIKAIVHTGSLELPCLGTVPMLEKPVDPRELAGRIEAIARSAA